MVARAKVRFLATDIWDTPDDGKRYEVIDGDLYMTPPPNMGHQGASITLAIVLGAFIRLHDLGRLYSAPTGVVLDDENGLQPDLLFVSRERLGIITEKAVEGAPDLVVEILSPRTQSRDRGIKMRRYAASGVRHYWIVDTRRCVLEAYRLESSAYVLAGTFRRGDIFRPELFPGLGIPITDLCR